MKVLKFDMGRVPSLPSLPRGFGKSRIRGRWKRGRGADLTELQAFHSGLCHSDRSCLGLASSQRDHEHGDVIARAQPLVG